MRKIIFITLTALLLTMVLPGQIQAKKKIIRPSRSLSTVSKKPLISPRLRADRKALIVNFSNLSTASSLSYELTYSSEGISQGVVGTITPDGQTSTQRELLFGTCSKNVCRYHTALSEMKFVVISTLTTGTKIKKTYRIKP